MQDSALSLLKLLQGATEDSEYIFWGVALKNEHYSVKNTVCLQHISDRKSEQQTLIPTGTVMKGFVLKTRLKAEQPGRYTTVYKGRLAPYFSFKWNTSMCDLAS